MNHHHLLLPLSQSFSFLSLSRSLSFPLLFCHLIGFTCHQNLSRDESSLNFFPLRLIYYFFPKFWCLLHSFLSLSSLSNCTKSKRKRERKRRKWERRERVSWPSKVYQTWNRSFFFGSNRWSLAWKKILSLMVSNHETFIKLLLSLLSSFSLSFSTFFLKERERERKRRKKSLTWNSNPEVLNLKVIELQPS